MITNVYSGVLQAGAPVTHGGIMPEGWDDFHGKPRSDIRNENHQFLRSLPVAVMSGRDEMAETVFRSIYVVSGNSLRHYVRELLTDYTLDILDIQPEDLNPKVAHFLYSGGVQEKGQGEGADYEAIDERRLLRENVPIADLFGGVLSGHFFEGSLRVHYAIPLVRDLFWLYSDAGWYLQERGIPWDALPWLDELNSQVINNPVGYTRSLPEQIADIDWGKSGDKDTKARGIYTMDALPIGTLLAHRFVLIAPVKNSQVCFEAGLELLLQNPYVGSQGGKGHGFVVAEYRRGDEKLNGALETYTSWLEENKEDLKQYIKEIPNRFPAKAKDYREANKKEPKRRRI